MAVSSTHIANVTQPAWRANVRDHLALTKPRIIELLLITTVPAMFAAAGGWPGTGLLVATVVAGALVSGSAHAVNMVLDRDIDAAMTRTAHRPLPSGRLTPTHALKFAVTLLISGTVLMAAVAGPVAAALTTAAWLWYVAIYTCWLKRRTPQNIVIGGVAGAAPPMIGWAAVTGTIAWPAVAMFALVVAWTPIHFWALAVGTGNDYARAGVPMLPTIKGPKAAAAHATRYAEATVVTSLFVPLSGVGGVPLGAFLIVLGGWFVITAHRFAADPVPRRAWRTFHASNAYLAAVFVAIGITGILP